jgi:amino acid transporter
VFFICGQSPGVRDIYNEEFPFTPGFQNGLNISDGMALVFAMPGTFLTSYGFLFSFGRVIHASAQSKLVPQWLETKSDATPGCSKQPFAALLFGAALGFLLQLVFYLSNDSYIEAFLGLVGLCRCVSFISLMYSFVYFRRSFGHMHRAFHSPLGLMGALFGIAVFTFGFVAIFVSVSGLSVSSRNGLIVLLASFFVLTGVPYVCFIRKNQYYSPEEQSMLFSVYLVQGTLVVCYLPVLNSYLQSVVTFHSMHSKPGPFGAPQTQAAREVEPAESCGCGGRVRNHDSHDSHGHFVASFVPRNVGEWKWKRQDGQVSNPSDQAVIE